MSTKVCNKFQSNEINIFLKFFLLDNIVEIAFIISGYKNADEHLLKKIRIKDKIERNNPTKVKIIIF